MARWLLTCFCTDKELRALQKRMIIIQKLITNARLKVDWEVQKLMKILTAIITISTMPAQMEVEICVVEQTVTWIIDRFTTETALLQQQSKNLLSALSLLHLLGSEMIKLIFYTQKTIWMMKPKYWMLEESLVVNLQRRTSCLLNIITYSLKEMLRHSNFRGEVQKVIRVLRE